MENKIGEYSLYLTVNKNGKYFCYYKHSEDALKKRDKVLKEQKEQRKKIRKEKKKEERQFKNEN